jgi:hypothetical protein
MTGAPTEAAAEAAEAAAEEAAAAVEEEGEAEEAAEAAEAAEVAEEEVPRPGPRLVLEPRPETACARKGSARSMLGRYAWATQPGRLPTATR